MTAVQSRKLYEIPAKHSGNPRDANAAVTEIEQVAASKPRSRKRMLLTKDDKIDLIDYIDKSKTTIIIQMAGTGVP